jgi:hypothetical protein
MILVRLSAPDHESSRIRGVVFREYHPVPRTYLFSIRRALPAYSYRAPPAVCPCSRTKS